MKKQGGYSLVELVIVIALVSALASAFTALFVPQVQAFISLPERHLVQSAALDVMDAVVEGDALARGLRFAGRSGAASVLTAADAASLTFGYRGQDGVDHTVALSYSAANKRFTRNVDSGGAQNVPTFGAGADGARIVIDAVDGNFFRYYDAAGAELTGAPLSAGDRANVRRVDVAFRVGLGPAGTAIAERAMVTVKTGVDLKNIT